MTAPGEYEIIEVVASGAYGTVCTARSLIEPDAPAVALKVLKKNMLADESAVVRLRDEARMLSRLRHSNILRVHDLLPGDRPVVVMEWVRGVSLERLSQAHPRGVKAAEALEILLEVALALDAAWSECPEPGGPPLRIVHRDIKPSNILLSIDGDVKVVDFGIARGDFDDREAVTVQPLLGTRGFMAPERLNGECNHPAVDIYALGITAFLLITGRTLPLSILPDRHREALRKNLSYMKPEGLDEEAAIQLRELIFEMASYEAEQRPSASDVVTRLAQLMRDSELRPDLASFGREVIRPLYEERTRMAPFEHPRFGDVSFLADPTTLRGPASPAELRAHQKKVRAFVRAADWPDRVEELRELLAECPGWSERPLVRLLKQWRKPWWKFWVRQTGDDELREVLKLLRLRATDDVLEACRPLLQHSDNRIADAALSLMETARDTAV